MPDLFDEFLRTPDGPAFMALRDVVLATRGYRFYSLELAELAELRAEQRHAELLSRAVALTPYWLLSPSLHALAAESAEALGLEQQARQRRYLAKACLQGLRQSGDGTSVAPYRITHLDDEYDLLASLGHTALSRRRETQPTAAFDVAVCQDGTELYFDLTPGLRETWT